MNMYNLIEYSDNYEYSTASLYHFKRQKPLANNANLTVAGSSSFRYKSDLLGKTSNINYADPNNPVLFDDNPIWKNAQIVVPLKYISSFFRSLEMPLINTKLYIQLKYTKDSVISTVDADNSTTFKITKAELYVPVVTLKAEENNKLNQLLDTKFKRTVYWNEYKSKIETIGQKDLNRVKRNDHRKYFLPRVYIKDYNVLIDGRNFYDQSASDDFKKYEELRKVMTRRGEDYTTGSLLDYDYWKRNYKLICCDLSKQKGLNSNPKAN